MLKIVFLSLILSSCGLIDQFKTPEQPTDANSSSEVNTSEPSSDPLAESAETNESGEVAAVSEDVSDDLFTKTLEETSATDSKTHSDNPSNTAAYDSELKTLEDEFAANGPNETKIKETQIAVTPAKNAPPKEAPVLVEEALPEITTHVETPDYNEAGAVKTYSVQRGDTLMQIAFKIYGDVSRWKDIKSMNADKLTNNGSLKTNMKLSYRAPSSPFVWNPSGTPYLIKNGETLGTISNTVYSTPKKWKNIWENNKPLIKNPNVIYAGFTLYYTNGAMANYVQPKSAQPKQEILARELAKSEAAKEGIVEEIVIDKASAKNQIVVDETVERLSASQKDEKEIDLTNSITAPLKDDAAAAPELAPDIDEEIQTLE